MTHNNTYRNGKVHVMPEKCDTCIFRPGNKMRLQEGRVKDMVDGCLTSQGVIPCHKTLGGDNSICRGFYDSYADDIQALQVAKRVGIIKFDDPTVQQEEEATK